MKTHGLTDRQWEVAQHIAACEPVKTIALKLNISVFAVHRHIEHIVYAWHLRPDLESQAQIVRHVTMIATTTTAAA